MCAFLTLVRSQLYAALLDHLTRSLGRRPGYFLNGLLCKRVASAVAVVAHQGEQQVVVIDAESICAEAFCVARTNPTHLAQREVGGGD
jgi:hypothetical protein